MSERERGLGRRDQHSCPPEFLGSNVHWPASTEPSRTLSLSLCVCMCGWLDCWSTLLSLEQTSVEAQVVGDCGLGPHFLASWHWMSCSHCGGGAAWPPHSSKEGRTWLILCHAGSRNRAWPWKRRRGSPIIFA